MLISGNWCSNPLFLVLLTAKFLSRCVDYRWRRKKIEAIRVFRAHTGAGLGEAKNAVEHIARGEPLPESAAIADSAVHGGARAPDSVLFPEMLRRPRLDSSPLRLMQEAAPGRTTSRHPFRSFVSVL